jgi:hypothetical protein
MYVINPKIVYILVIKSPTKSLKKPYNLPYLSNIIGHTQSKFLKLTFIHNWQLLLENN